MKKLLYVDGCVCRETSRTERLAQAYLQKVLSETTCELKTLVLENAELTPLNARSLGKRESAIRSGDFSGKKFQFAKDFASADALVIAVPYWDLSFPSMLKIYLEHLCVRNLTFKYSESGMPQGLTNIQKAVYITTAGGYIRNSNFGFEYVQGLLQNLFTIPETAFISAEGLDVNGNDPEAIMAEAIRSLPSLF